MNSKIIFPVIFLILTMNYCGNNNDPVKLSKKLIDAAENGDLKEVILLLDKKADVHTLDKVGKSALTYAALNAHDDIVEVLLKSGAGQGMKDSVSDVLVVAIKMNQQETRDPKKYSKFQRILKLLAESGIK